MIHRLTIENFGSIREAQTIELALPRTTPNLPRFRTSLFDTRLPTVVALFGANASGKSTVLSAIAEVLEFAAGSFGSQNERPLRWFEPFRATGWRDQPTRIAVDFEANWLAATPELFRYDLVFAHDEPAGERVGSEGLSVRQGARFHTLFRRDANGIRVKRGLGLDGRDKRLQAVGPKVSVISTMAALNVAFFEGIRSEIVQTQTNFVGRTRHRRASDVVLSYLQHNPIAFTHLRHELRRLDVGLDDMQIDRGPGGLFPRFKHDGLDGPLYLHEESEGTQHFLQMFPALFVTLDQGRPALIDEFDADLHPRLAAEILGWFHDPERNRHGAQLFLTSHNTALLDELEKEEVFLVEKSADGASHIKPVRDFEGLRREQSLAKKYQAGALGAVPNIG